MNARIVWIIVGVVAGVATLVAGLIVLILVMVFHLMDTADAHVCGLAYVQNSPAAQSMLGTPIVQHGFTGGSSNSTNGETTERITFNVSGPLGTAFVLSEGRRTPLESHLDVKFGRDQASQTAYSGPFDCPELHKKK